MHPRCFINFPGIHYRFILGSHHSIQLHTDFQVLRYLTVNISPYVISFIVQVATGVEAVLFHITKVQEVVYLFRFSLSTDTMLCLGCDLIKTDIRPLGFRF